MAYLVGSIVLLILWNLVHNIRERHHDHTGKRPWGPSGW